MKQILLGLLINLVVIVPAFSQTFTVNGTVTDQETGEPLPGVNVSIEGTFQGTITNFDGVYSLDVPSKDTVLVFSFIGMKTITERVDGRATIDVVMSSDSEEIEEVMVVAYGTTTKEAYTGAADVVDNEVIENRPVTSFEKALQGTTPGLQVASSSGQPGSTATVRIRGIGSLSASSSPLYVIDGVPNSGGLSDLNPNDIESVTVLKDAAASSLYGSRAANGVIIITTKQGEEGKAQISFSGSTGVSSRISDGYKLMNSSQIYEHSWMGLYNWGVLYGENEDGTKWTIDDAKNYAHEKVEGTVGFNPFGVDNPLDENGKVIPGTKVVTDTDWRDEVYKQGIINNYNLNVSGGTEATKVYMSLGYFSDSGIALSSDFRRYSAKVNVTQKVTDFLTAGVNSMLSFSETNAPPGGGQGSNPIRSAEIINAASPVRNNDGTYNWENKAVFDFNPVALAEMDIYEGKTKRNVINAYLNFQILPSLTFRTTGGIDNSTGQSLVYYNKFHGNGAGVNGRSTQSSSDAMAWDISNILTWTKRGDNSSFEALIGQEAHGQEISGLSAGVTDFAVPNRPELSWGSEPEQPSSSTSDWTMVSYLGQAKYNWGGKYYLSASVRGDGSSRFGEENKYGVFYSVGSSWRISQESWWPSWQALNDLKLRSSYGTSGNNSIGNYASLGLYGSGANYGGFPGLAPAQQEQANLTWEKIASFNFGLEAQMFQKLSINAEFYQRKSDGLLYNKPLSSSKGFTSIKTNLGAMQNTGFELSLEYDVVRTSAFTYTTGLNASTNFNKILELGQDRILGGTKILEPGGDIYQFFMREWAGVNPETGEPMWFTNEDSDDVEPEDGEESEVPESAFEDPHGSGRTVTSVYGDAERIRMGTAAPDFYGGWNNSLSYGNFDLSFYFYFNVGGLVYNSAYATNMHDGRSPGDNLAVDALEAWTPNNKDTNVPRYVTNNQDAGEQLSSRFLEDASYARLKNIQLGYNLPSKWVNKVKLNNARIYVGGENLWTLTNFKGFDPEGSLNGTTNSSIPGVKTVTFGVKMNL